MSTTTAPKSRSIFSWRVMSRPAPETDELPHVVGRTQIWWIRKPRGPRMSVRIAMMAWGILIPVVSGTLLLLVRSGLDLWPFNRPAGSPPPTRIERVYKYELLFAAILVYTTMRSVLAWWQYHRLARRDALEIGRMLSAGAYRKAAEHLHRFCLLHRAVWSRLPVRVAQWDAIVRRHLPSGPRLYIYYRLRPPALPEDSTSSFMPEVTPVGQPRWWFVLWLLPMAAALYTLVMRVAADRSNLYRLLSVNSVLMISLLVGYGTFYVRWILGRSNYFRLGPGIAQFIRYKVLSARPAIETFDLRAHDVVLDLTGRSPAVTFVGRTTCPEGQEKRQQAIRTIRIPDREDVVTACLRAVLSTAPTPPMTEEGLVG